MSGVISDGSNGSVARENQTPVIQHGILSSAISDISWTWCIKCDVHTVCKLTLSSELTDTLQRAYAVR